MDHPSPHDSFIKGILKHAKPAREFLQLMLPSPMAEMVDWEKLKLEPGSYVDENLVGTQSDLLFSCTFRGRPGFLYFLVEHQITVDPIMPLRIARYCLSVVEDWRKAHPSENFLPVVVPVVFHQGRGRWGAPTSLLELYELDSNLEGQFGSHLVNVRFLLSELRNMDLGKVRAGLVLRLTVSLMKAVVERRQLEWIDSHGTDLSELLLQEDGRTVLRTMFNYILWTEKRGRSASTVKEIASKVGNEQLKKEFMSLAEAIQQEGRTEGRLQGRLEGLRTGQREVLIREIQVIENVLGQTPETEPEGLSLEELEDRLAALHGQLRERILKQNQA